MDASPRPAPVNAAGMSPAVVPAGPGDILAEGVGGVGAVREGRGDACRRREVAAEASDASIDAVGGLVAGAAISPDEIPTDTSGTWAPAEAGGPGGDPMRRRRRVRRRNDTGTAASR